MKRISVALVFLVAVVSTTSAVFALSGGPDAAGYTFRDTAEPNGPLFIANDISVTGTVLAGVTDDSVTPGVPIGFSFTMYGTAFTTVNVGANGNIQFDSASGTFSNLALPSAFMTRAVHAFWDDLNPSCAGSSIRTLTSGAAPNRRFTVQWMSGIFGACANGTVTFQIILFESTNEILVQYMDSTFTPEPSPAHSNGVSATAGIQSGATSLQYSFNTGVLVANLAICYRPAGASAASVCGRTIAATAATLNVHKDFSDTNTSPVTISVTCTDVVVNNDTAVAAATVGGPLTARDNPDVPAVFNVTNVPAAGTLCTAIESPVPAGYTANQTGCSNVFVGRGTTVDCTIVNTFNGIVAAGQSTPTPTPVAPTPTPVPPAPPPIIPQVFQNPNAIPAIMGGIGNGTRNNTPVPSRPAVTSPATTVGAMPALRPPSTGDAGLAITVVSGD